MRFDPEPTQTLNLNIVEQTVEYKNNIEAIATHLEKDEESKEEINYDSTQNDMDNSDGAVEDLTKNH
jgi:hypothetical protein